MKGGAQGDVEHAQNESETVASHKARKTAGTVSS